MPKQGISKHGQKRCSLPCSMYVKVPTAQRLSFAVCRSALIDSLSLLLFIFWIFCFGFDFDALGLNRSMQG